MKKVIPIENKIYKSIIGLCEQKENKGIYKGNGHHLAQEISVKVSECLLMGKQAKIYEALDKEPTPVKDIANKCKMTSNIVSAQLHQIYNSTLLIHFKKNKKNKLWYRIH